MSDQPGPVSVPPELRKLLAHVDPVPTEVVDAARESFGWRDLDARLAELVADNSPVAAGVRGEPSRLLTYQSGDHVIELEVSQAAGRLRVVGQLVPPRPAIVRVSQPAGEREVSADRLGRFAIHDLPPGPTRFGCRPVDADAAAPSDAEVETPWVLL